MNWKTYIEQAIKTGLESPTPYKVIPYKNGIGIKKIIIMTIPAKRILAMIVGNITMI